MIHKSLKVNKILCLKIALKVPICETSAQSVNRTKAGKGERRHETEKGCAKKGLQEITQAKREKRLAQRKSNSKSLADQGSHLQIWQAVSEKILACHAKKCLIE